MTFAREVSGTLFRMNPNDLSQELEALRTRITELERARAAPKSRRRFRLIAAALAVTGAVVAGTASAANGACPNGLPFCFQENTPALASEVNHNFSQVKEWMETKAGPVGTSAVVTPRLVVLDGGTLVVPNGLMGAGSGGNFVIESPAGPMFLNYGSRNQVAINSLPGGAAAAVFNNNGGLDLNDHVVSRTSIPPGRRAPSSVITGYNNGNSSAATCPSGTVVKMAFGFHGMPHTSRSETFVCGQAISWLGGCIGQTSCTMTSGCATTGVWIECW